MPLFRNRKKSCCLEKKKPKESRSKPFNSSKKIVKISSNCIKTEVLTKHGKNRLIN